MPQLENIYHHSRLAVATQLVKTWICTSLVDLMIHADWALPSNRELQLSFIQVMKAYVTYHKHFYLSVPS